MRREILSKELQCWVWGSEIDFFFFFVLLAFLPYAGSVLPQASGPFWRTLDISLKWVEDVFVNVLKWAQNWLWVHNWVKMGQNPLLTHFWTHFRTLTKPMFNPL